MYNNSTFHDFTKSVADGGLSGSDRSDAGGNLGFYLLGDRQIWQAAPDRPGRLIAGSMPARRSCMRGRKRRPSLNITRGACI